jgi:hypothetical protein
MLTRCVFYRLYILQVQFDLYSENYFKARLSYKEASSDDDFATKNFMFSSSDDDSDNDNQKRKNKRKRKDRDHAKHSKSSSTPKVKDVVDLDGDNTNTNEDAEFNVDITSKISQSDADSDSDGSDDSDPDAPSYRIQYILARKDMSAKDWITICGGMYTHEVTRGSVWQQPDEEFFDPSPKPVEKFLIKWVHASYLHLSWETEKDLLEIVGSTAKSAIKKFRLREYYGEYLIIIDHL